MMHDFRAGSKPTSTIMAAAWPSSSTGHQGPRFGTFTGVFTPSLLTTLGVMMYARVGWLVGNAGLLGAWAVMTLATMITVCIGLSLSCQRQRPLRCAPAAPTTCSSPPRRARRPASPKR